MIIPAIHSLKQSEPKTTNNPVYHIVNSHFDDENPYEKLFMNTKLQNLHAYSAKTPYIVRVSTS